MCIRDRIIGNIKNKKFLKEHPEALKSNGN